MPDDSGLASERQQWAGATPGELQSPVPRQVGLLRGCRLKAVGRRAGRRNVFPSGEPNVRAHGLTATSPDRFLYLQPLAYSLQPRLCTSPAALPHSQEHRTEQALPWELNSCESSYVPEGTRKDDALGRPVESRPRAMSFRARLSSQPAYHLHCRVFDSVGRWWPTDRPVRDFHLCVEREDYRLEAGCKKTSGTTHTGRTFSARGPLGPWPSS